jgi:nucleotide-binding universal stress UspA family protein
VTVNSSNTVVVGVDGSDQSGDAIALAVTLAEPLAARLSPVFVHPYALSRGRCLTPVRCFGSASSQQK